MCQCFSIWQSNELKLKRASKPRYPFYETVSRKGMRSRKLSLAVFPYDLRIPILLGVSNIVGPTIFLSKFFIGGWNH